MSKQTNEITISQFFHLEEALTTKKMESEAQKGRFQEMKERVISEFKSYKVPDAFYDMLFKQVMQLLNIEIPDLLTQTWSKYEELAKYLDEKKYPPTDTFYSPLSKHTFSSEHTPSLKPTINRIPLGKISIKAVFKLQLEGVLLQIRAGKIEGFKIGKCLGSGALSIQDIEMISKSTQPWNFPTMIMLKKPLQIPNIKKKLSETQAVTREMLVKKRPETDKEQTLPGTGDT